MFILVAPMVTGLFLEAPLFLVLDRFPRARIAALSLVLMAVCTVAAALAIGPWSLAIALAVSGLASGLSTGIAQAALVDGDPENREHRLGQWTLAGELGDLAAPLLLGAMAFASFGWRGTMIAAAVLTCISALQIARTKLPRSAEDEEEEERPSIRLALRNRRLLAWLFAAGLCALLDETLVAFAVLFVRDRLGGDLAAQGAVVGASTAGAMIGLMAMPRLLRRMRPLSLLILSAAGSALAFGAWLLAPSILWSIGLMFLTGAFTALHYPLTRAQAYAALPERSSLVNSLSALFTPIDLAAPLLIGLAADRFGLVAAMALLLSQPLGILAVALVARSRQDRRAL